MGKHSYRLAISNYKERERKKKTKVFDPKKDTKHSNALGHRKLESMQAALNAICILSFFI